MNLKKLNTVTLKDAKEIISSCSEYTDLIYANSVWEITKEKRPENELVSIFKSKNKYFFEFTAHNIMIRKAVFFGDEPIIHHANHLCYIKAIELGYYVVGLSELLQQKGGGN